jgi:hypothetical protein
MMLYTTCLWDDPQVPVKLEILPRITKIFPDGALLLSLDSTSIIVIPQDYYDDPHDELNPR